MAQIVVGPVEVPAIAAERRVPCLWNPVLHPSTRIGTWTGPMRGRRTSEEQTAACPVHGRSPFNNLPSRLCRSEVSRLRNHGGSYSWK